MRVEGAASGSLRIETCPISGTIERGSDPLEDALQIRKLLSSVKVTHSLPHHRGSVTESCSSGGERAHHVHGCGPQ